MSSLNRSTNPAESQFCHVCPYASTKALASSPLRLIAVRSRHTRLLPHAPCRVDTPPTGIEMARNTAPGAHALRGRYARRDDLCELDRVDELPEPCELAVADLPDVDCRLVQGLAGRLTGARVADDRRDG